MAFKIKLQRETQRKVKTLFSFGSKTADIYFMVRGLRDKPTKADWISAAWKVGEVFGSWMFGPRRPELRTCRRGWRVRTDTREVHSDCDP